MRSLFVSHTGMTEPLGRSQVLPYLRGLAAAGWGIEVVGFEPPAASLDEISRVAGELAGAGIAYSWTRRSPSHALGVKVGEMVDALGRLVARALDPRRGGRPRVVHARSTLPAAVAHTLAALVPGARFLFDCRGLLGEEYVDAGHWRRGSFAHRLVGRAEAHLFRRAHGVVVLTEALRHHLVEVARAVPRRTPIEVIPCCVDVARFTTGTDARARGRLHLGLAAGDDRFVLAYAGTLGSWYCEEEMARLYAAVRRERPARFAVFTRADATPLRRALAAHGVPDGEVHVEAAAPSEMPALLAAADGAVSFITPCFSKIASSPTKVAEYLAVGLPVAMNRGIGDAAALLDARPDVTVDAGRLSPGEIDRAGRTLVARAADPSTAAAARRAAAEHFSVDGIGVARYRRIYESIAS